MSDPAAKPTAHQQDEILLLAEKLGEIADRVAHIETEFTAQTAPLDASKSTIDGAVAALHAALAGIKALNFHVLDNNLGAVSKRVETVAEQATKSIEALDQKLAEFERVRNADAKELAKQFNLTEQRRTELAAKRDADQREFAQSVANITRDVTALRAAVSEQIQLAKQEFAEPKSFNPTGKWEPRKYARLDLAELNGTTYVSRTDDNEEQPGRNARNWQTLARRAVSGGGGLTQSDLEAQRASQSDSDSGVSSVLLPTVKTAKRVMRTKHLAQLYANILARQAASEPINFVFYGDSLTNDTEYITRLRGLLQGVLGDGGLGWQPWSVWNEVGSTKIGYTGWDAYDQNTANAPTGIQAHFPGLAGVLGQTGDAATNFEFTGGSTPQRAASAFDLWYVKGPAGGTFTASTPDGDTVAGISSLDAGGFVLAKQAITGVKTDDSSGTYARVSSVSGDVGLAGINIKLGTTGLRLHNLSLPSSSARQWAALDGTSVATFLSDIDPDLAVIELGINDRNARTPAEYAADIETLITRLRTANANCVVVLVASDNDALQNATLDSYRDELITLCNTYDCEFLDVSWLLDVDLISGDTIHPTDAGFNAKALQVFRYLGGYAMRYSFGITPYGQTYPDLAINAATVGGYAPGDGLVESNLSAEADESLTLTAGNSNDNVILRYSGSGSVYVTDRNNTNYRLLLQVGSTYASLQALTNGTGFRELRLNPSGGALAVYKTITADGTTGNQTVNRVAGSVNFAAAATSLVVTNNLVSTSSVILVTVATNDATMTSARVVAASGSFTIYANAAATAETRVNFLVLN